MFYRWFNNIYDGFFIPGHIFLRIILLIRMILHWDRCAKLPQGGGHHRKADDIQSLRVEGCQLDCRWFDTPSLRASCLRSRYLCAACCACVSRAYHDWGRSVNSLRLCICIQWGRTNWVMRCSFRNNTINIPSNRNSCNGVKRRRPQMHHSQRFLELKFTLFELRNQRHWHRDSWYKSDINLVS
jgi:hypothetical protein